MIKIFRGQGVVDGEGGSSEGCLKWGGGSLRIFAKTSKNGGAGKGKSCSWGRGVGRCYHPCPPQKILIIHS